MRSSERSSDVCSSDLDGRLRHGVIRNEVRTLLRRPALPMRAVSVAVASERPRATGVIGGVHPHPHFAERGGTGREQARDRLSLVYGTSVLLRVVLCRPFFFSTLILSFFFFLFF